jgi:hypothetical protein
MAFVPDIHVVKTPEWGLDFYWDFQFILPKEEAPIQFPFNIWFPATDITETLWNPENAQVFDVGMNQFPIPKSLQQRALILTFADDVKNTLEKWFSNWYSFIYSVNNNYVRVLEEIVRSVIIKKLNSKKEVMNTTSYLIFPTSPLVYDGKSTSGVRLYTVQCAIVGEQRIILK